MCRRPVFGATPLRSRQRYPIGPAAGRLGTVLGRPSRRPRECPRMSRRPRKTAGTGPSRPTVSVCRGCCCGTPKIPGVDHAGQLAQLRNSSTGPPPCGRWSAWTPASTATSSSCSPRPRAAVPEAVPSGSAWSTTRRPSPTSPRGRGGRPRHRGPAGDPGPVRLQPFPPDPGRAGGEGVLEDPPASRPTGQRPIPRRRRAEEEPGTVLLSTAFGQPFQQCGQRRPDGLAHRLLGQLVVGRRLRVHHEEPGPVLHRDPRQ